MSGSKESGLKAAATIKRKYGQDFYKHIGAKGAQAWLDKPKEERLPKGFAAMPHEIVSAAGYKGGKISKRGKALDKK